MDLQYHEILLRDHNYFIVLILMGWGCIGAIGTEGAPGEGVILGTLDGISLLVLRLLYIF